MPPPPPANRAVTEIFADWFVATTTVLATSLAWRGAWVLMDALLFPECPFASAAAGLGIGVGGYLVIVILAPFERRWLVHTSGVLPSGCGTYIAALYNYCGIWVVIASWRGIWELWDQAFGVGSEGGVHRRYNRALVLSALTSHLAGMAIVVALDAFQSLTAPQACMTSSRSADPLQKVAWTLGSATWYGLDTRENSGSVTPYVLHSDPCSCHVSTSTCK
jgi:hypothetical protein